MLTFIVTFIANSVSFTFDKNCYVIFRVIVNSLNYLTEEMKQRMKAHSHIHALHCGKLSSLEQQSTSILHRNSWVFDWSEAQKIVSIRHFLFSWLNWIFIQWNVWSSLIAERWVSMNFENSHLQVTPMYMFINYILYKEKCCT